MSMMRALGSAGVLLVLRRRASVFSTLDTEPARHRRYGGRGIHTRSSCEIQMYVVLLAGVRCPNAGGKFLDRIKSQALV
jgi:hypothetical protein